MSSATNSISPNHKEQILVSLKKVFKPEDYSVKFEEDNLNINYLENNQCILQISMQELSEELISIKNFSDYLTVGDDFFNTMVSLEHDSNIKEIEVVGQYKGSIEKGQLAIGLILFNADYAIDINKINNAEINELNDVLYDNRFVITINKLELLSELKQSSKSNQFPDITVEIDKIIYSLLTQISYTNHLTFKNPRSNIVMSKEISINEHEKLKISFKKSIDSEPLLYFLAAEEMEYPHLRYLEYYHVLEYYFNHARIEKMDKIINNLVSIKLQNGDKVDESFYNDFSLLMNYYSDQQQKRAEEDRLVEILRDKLGYGLIIGTRDLKDFEFLSKTLFDIDQTRVNTKTILDRKKSQIASSASTFDVNKKDGDLFCKELAHRIYKIRNFIVHTKKYERDNIFIPSQENYALLREDVNLIREIAHLIITNY